MSKDMFSRKKGLRVEQERFDEHGSFENPVVRIGRSTSGPGRLRPGASPSRLSNLNIARIHTNPTSPN
jgi:hypothetical protein